MTVAWFCLRVFPFSRVYQAFEFAGRSIRNKKMGNNHDSDQICSAVNRVGLRLLGDESCLTQALCGRMLLQRSGYEPILKIGVTKTREGDFRAHAWVELDGAIVIGGPTSQVETFTPLGDLENLNL